MHKIDWNEASKLGLVEKINREVLHPLGLAMTRNPETGKSDSLLIADDGLFTYSENMETTMISDESIRLKLQEVVGDKHA